MRGTHAQAGLQGYETSPGDIFHPHLSHGAKARTWLLRCKLCCGADGGLRRRQLMMNTNDSSMLNGRAGGSTGSVLVKPQWVRGGEVSLSVKAPSIHLSLHIKKYNSCRLIVRNRNNSGCTCTPDQQEAAHPQGLICSAPNKSE